MNRHTTVEFLSCSQGKSVKDTRTHWRTDGTTAALQYPLRNALRGDKYNTAKRSIPAHPTFVNDAHRDLHLWPVTFKINWIHPLTMANMPVKLNEEAHKV